MIPYSLVYTKEMVRGMKRMEKRGKNTAKLDAVLKVLSSGARLPPSFRDHALVGNWKGCRGCHIEPDWLLIYEILDDELVLVATRTGTHSDLY